VSLHLRWYNVHHSDCAATTSFGLAEDVKVGRETLMNTQSSLGVRAGCQLWERFFSLSRPGDLVCLSINMGLGILTR